MSQATKKYWEMTQEELREAIKEFDAESPPGTWKPASAKSKLLWDRARRVTATPAKSDAERDADVARFDREIGEAELRPLTRKARLLHEMAGIPVPTRKVTVEIDAALVSEAESRAENHKVSLDHFIEESIREMLAFSEPK